MKIISNNLYRRAILHVDGDSFFASCEVARNPSLKGKPVVTGKERGIASAMTYEAKAKGVTRGMSIRDIRKVCPDVIFLSSDCETYSLYSKRMYSIVRRYTPRLEEYSIDECFADITGLEEDLGMSYQMIAKNIADDLEKELGITFSIGLGPNKVLAIVASNWNKPRGLTFISIDTIGEYLSKLPISKVWGIGVQTSSMLSKYGIKSTYDFANKEESWVIKHVSKPYQEIWHELHGRVVYEINTKNKRIYKSISKTKTFTPPSYDKSFIFSQLSKNIENACIKARRHNLYTLQVSFFLKTQDFKYFKGDVRLPRIVSTPDVIIKSIEKSFNKIYKINTLYRATGVTLYKLTKNSSTQMDLFDTDIFIDNQKQIYTFIDSLATKFGKNVVFLGSSLEAIIKSSNKREHSHKKYKETFLFKGETKRKRLGIPILGDAS